MNDILNIILGVLVGSTLGTYIGTEIAYRRTERWLRRLLSDGEFRALVVEWLKGTAEQFKEEYIVKKLESGEFRALVGRAKEEVIGALLGGADLPDLEDFGGGGDV